MVESLATNGPRPGNEAMLPQAYRVTSRRSETHDVVTLDLRPASDAPPPAFLPGQFNMLYAFGAGEVPISISGDPGERSSLVHTIRGVGAASRALCALQEGATLGLRGPFGSGWPTETAPGTDLILIAGGIGLAPLRPMLLHALAHRVHYGRVWVLIGARSERDLLFTKELETWRDRGADLEVTVDAAGPDWRGHVGVVTRRIPKLTFGPTRCQVMVCGPEIMMRYTTHALQDRGVSPKSIFLTMERNMKCAIGLCGHCQYGADFLCKQGPVFCLEQVASRLDVAEL